MSLENYVFKSEKSEIDLDDLESQVDNLDEMVFDHEDLLNQIICVLLDEPGITKEAKVVLQDCWNMMHKQGKYAKKEGENGK